MYSSTLDISEKDIDFLHIVGNREQGTNFHAKGTKNDFVSYFYFRSQEPELR